MENSFNEVFFLDFTTPLVIEELATYLLDEGGSLVILGGSFAVTLGVLEADIVIPPSAVMTLYPA